MSASIRLSYGYRGAQAIVANLHAADRRAQREMRRAVADALDLGYDVAQFLAPEKTGFMKRNLKRSFSEDGLVGELGFEDEDFRRLRPEAPPYPEKGHALYAAYVNDGTVNQKANGFLTTAYEEMKDALGRDVSRALRRAIARR